MLLLRSGRAALASLTRIPVGGFPYTNSEMSLAPVWFPAVGLIVGCVSGAVWWMSQSLGGTVAAIVAVASSVILTGALHEDGLADTADALGATRDREKILTILKDPRVGTYGVLALIIIILLRVSLLAPRPDVWIILLISHTVSRWAPTILIAWLPYVTKPEVSRSGGVMAANWLAVLGATACLAAIMGMTRLVWSVSIVGMMWVVIVVVAVTGLCGWQFRKRIGGVTGDMLGAAEQLAHVSALVMTILSQG